MMNTGSGKSPSEDASGRYLGSIVSILKQSLQDIRCEAYLFGSRATGTHAEASDFDIAVLSPDDIAGELSRVRERLETSNIPFMVDLIDGNAMTGDFIKKVKQEGILIWSN